MTVEFSHREEVAKGITSFFFKQARPLRYIAGQFISLQIDHDKVDNRGNKRWFTLSSSPKDKLISITTGISDDHGSFKKALNSLKQGDEVTITLPMGDFVLPKDKSIPLVFIAGGIGITPFKSIISDLRQNGEIRDITLLYAVSNENELAFSDQFTFLGDKYITHFGRITADSALELTSPNENSYLYISGPEQLVETLTNEIAALGFARQRIFTDYFHGYTA